VARESKHWRFIKMSTGCSFFLKSDWHHQAPRGLITHASSTRGSMERKYVGRLPNRKKENSSPNWQRSRPAPRRPITFFYARCGLILLETHTNIYRQICALYGLNSASCALPGRFSLPATHNMQLTAKEFDRNLQNGALTKVITFGSSHVRSWIILFHSSCGIRIISSGIHWKQRDVCKFYFLFIARHPHTNHVKRMLLWNREFIIGFLFMWLWTFY
jgi:hypothetical protein